MPSGRLRRRNGLLFELAWCSSAASITASGGFLRPFGSKRRIRAVVVGHGVLVRFLFRSPRELCATDGSRRSALPLATNGTQECRRQPCSSLSVSCPTGSGCQRRCPSDRSPLDTTCQAHPSPLGSAACYRRDARTMKPLRRFSAMPSMSIFAASSASRGSMVFVTLLFDL